MMMMSQQKQQEQHLQPSTLINTDNRSELMQSNIIRTIHICNELLIFHMHTFFSSVHPRLEQHNRSYLKNSPPLTAMIPWAHQLRGNVESSGLTRTPPAPQNRLTLNPESRWEPSAILLLMKHRQSKLTLSSVLVFNDIICQSYSP